MYTILFIMMLGSFVISLVTPPANETGTKLGFLGGIISTIGGIANSMTGGMLGNVLGAIGGGGGQTPPIQQQAPAQTNAYVPPANNNNGGGGNGEPTIWDKYSGWFIGVGLAVLAGLMYLFASINKKRR